MSAATTKVHCERDPGRVTVRRTPRLRLAAVAPAVITAPLVAGCSALRLGIVNHAGPVAAEQWRVYLILGVVLLFVAGPVLLLTPLMAWHYRLSNRGGAFRPDWGFSWPLEILIWVPPTGIVIGLGFLLWSSTHDLDPYRTIEGGGPPLEVEVVALDWKWLFLYPADRIASVDRLVVPARRPVHLTLTSGTVMQSFLVPQLGGQIYAMAGMRSQLYLAASRPGVFRGENTQYNGDGFHLQKFDVVALQPGAYRQFVMNVRRSAAPLDGTMVERLRRRSVLSRPVLFSSAPPGLFGRFVASTREPTR